MILDRRSCARGGGNHSRLCARPTAADQVGLHSDADRVTNAEEGPLDFMTGADRLDATFRLALGLPGDADLVPAAYGRTEGWDSVGHMVLMTGIEETFGISIDADDVFEMRDYSSVREILRDRYQIGV